MSITPWWWGALLLSRKAGKRLERPVRLPHLAGGCLRVRRLSAGCAEPTWAPASTALLARWTCWEHTCAFTSDIQEGTKQEPRTRHQLFIHPPPPLPTPQKKVWDEFQVRYPPPREGTFQGPDGCRRGVNVWENGVVRQKVRAAARRRPVRSWGASRKFVEP